MTHKNVKLATLGPKETYSWKAAQKWIRSRHQLQSPITLCHDVIDVINTVIQGDADQGIVPIENSLEGSVGITLDLLREEDIQIIGEVLIPIHHCLMSLWEPEEIEIILSHPQALAQCSRFLKEKFPKVKLGEADSTAHAAELVQKSKKNEEEKGQEPKKVAAIASEDAANKYGLQVLFRDIQDYKENITRFVVIGREKSERTGDDKTSIVVYLDNDRPGALYEILREFAELSINLTKIESRPSKKGMGDYVFYIDCEGSVEDPNIKKGLSNIEENTYMLKVLGSYPRGHV